MQKNALALFALALVLAACNVPAIDGPPPPTEHDAGEPDAGARDDCTGLGKTRSVSEACCPAFGIDACGANLFCAAFDGRTQATCYIDRSRLDLTDCSADLHCNSGSCDVTQSRCRSTPSMPCDPGVGCAPLPNGTVFACDARTASPSCMPVGDGTAGSVCASNKDCSSRICTDGGCACPGGTHQCGSQCVSNASVQSCGTSCSPCPTSFRGTATCDGTRCSFKCESGARLCGGDCRPCPTGSDVKATDCSGSACVATSCAAGSQLCSGACVTCPADPNATARGCSQGKCVSTGCAKGYTPANGVCVAQSEVVSKSFWAHDVFELQLDSQGQPHLAFSGNTSMKYARRTTSWQEETLDSHGGYGFYFPSLTFDATGAVQLSYWSDAFGEVRHAVRGTSGWTKERASNDVRQSRSQLALDELGAPHIAYTLSYAISVGESALEIHHSTKGATGWTKVRVDRDAVKLASLRLDASGAPVISYLLRNGVFRTARRTGTGWDFNDLPGLPAGLKHDFVIAPDGTVHVSYLNSTSKALSYAVHDGTQWNVQVVDAASSQFSPIALALTSGMSPVILYNDGGRHPKLARWNGMQWTLKSVDSGRFASLLDVAVDSQGRAHVVYDDDGSALMYLVIP